MDETQELITPYGAVPRAAMTASQARAIFDGEGDAAAAVKHVTNRQWQRQVKREAR